MMYKEFYKDYLFILLLEADQNDEISGVFGVDIRIREWVQVEEQTAPLRAQESRMARAIRLFVSASRRIASPLRAGSRRS